ncbi:MAG: hypothetical protein ACXVP0_18040, partial [Bacteroidia bacterium]
MNKKLLLVPAVLFAFGAYSQTGRQVKPTGAMNKMAARRPILEEAAAHKSAAPKTLIKPQQAPVTSAKTASSSAVNCTYFT